MLTVNLPAVYSTVIRVKFELSPIFSAFSNTTAARVWIRLWLEAINSHIRQATGPSAERITMATLTDTDLSYIMNQAEELGHTCTTCDWQKIQFQFHKSPNNFTYKCENEGFSDYLNRVKMQPFSTLRMNITKPVQNISKLYFTHTKYFTYMLDVFHLEKVN